MCRNWSSYIWINGWDRTQLRRLRLSDPASGGCRIPHAGWRRFATPGEVLYRQHGVILQFVLRQLPDK